jgi:hypothetical protein
MLCGSYLQRVCGIKFPSGSRIPFPPAGLWSGRNELPVFRLRSPSQPHWRSWTRRLFRLHTHDSHRFARKSPFSSGSGRSVDFSETEQVQLKIGFLLFEVRANIMPYTSADFMSLPAATITIKSGFSCQTARGNSQRKCNIHTARCNILTRFI